MVAQEGDRVNYFLILAEMVSQFCADGMLNRHALPLFSPSEYVNGDAHTNTLEGWFALLKRGVTGTFHHVSEQHLDRYVDEFAFHHNRRDVTDGERAVMALKKVSGKRLMYKDPKKKSN